MKRRIATTQDHQTGKFFLLLLCIITSIFSHSQSTLDSLFNKLDPQKWSAVVEKRLGKLEEKIISKSVKTLRGLQREEEKVYKKLLATKDSLYAKEKLDEIQSKYQGLSDKIRNPAASISPGSKKYIPYLDTLKTAFNFLDKDNVSGNIKTAIDKISSFENSFQQAEEIKKFIREQREQLKHQLEQLGLAKQLKKFNREIFYYGEHLKQFRSVISDKKKMERKAFELLSETKAFQEFFRKHSALASLFRMPGADPNDPSYLASLAGLQTRSQVNNLIQQQIAAGGPNAMDQFRNNLQQAQAQMQELKNKVLKSGGSSSDDIMPEGFKPNNLKAKSFFQRMEINANISSHRSNGLLPANSDFALGIGYKFSEKIVAGVAGSYRIGWGSGFNNIRITHEGIGGRFYFDVHAKNSFWITTTFELNYRAAFDRIDQLRDYSAWNRAGLVGVSKIVSVKSKFFKKTKVQLLWNYLYYSEVPKVGEPIVFRVGYNF